MSLHLFCRTHMLYVLDSVVVLCGQLKKRNSETYRLAVHVNISWSSKAVLPIGIWCFFDCIVTLHSLMCRVAYLRDCRLALHQATMSSTHCVAILPCCFHPNNQQVYLSNVVHCSPRMNQNEPEWACDEVCRTFRRPANPVSSVSLSISCTSCSLF